MKRGKVTDEQIHMLLFFAESCDSISQAVAKFVEKESLDGNSNAREIVRNNDFIKGKIAKDITGEDEEELESILKKMKDEERRITNTWKTGTCCR